MTYDEWTEAHNKKVTTILEKLGDRSVDEIADYFKFENMVVNEPDFCLLYPDNKKCHDVDNLNCYFCGCPYFMVNEEPPVDDKKIRHNSYCSINSVFKKDFYWGPDDNGIVDSHCDCSDCVFTHKEDYVKKAIRLQKEKFTLSDRSSLLDYIRDKQLKDIL